MSNIKLNPSKHSNLSKVNFNNLPFGRTFSDNMFTADWIDGEWTNFQIEPFGPFTVHPACLALHYGQAIFEGMKASKDIHGNPMLFRPEMHAIRMNASARRMCMPEFPEDVFLEAIHTLVRLESDWIPQTEGSALYIRPYMFANGNFIGVAPSNQYKYIIFCGPVGPYYPKPVNLIVENRYVRAAQGGVGEAKVAGNYAASLLPAKVAKEKGYDQVMWMDAKEFKYIQEAGTMNLFFVIDGVVVTPQTDGCILKGITRDSIITILKDKGYKVEQRKIAIDELVEAYKAGKLQEAFGTGTAAVVAHVASITYDELQMEFPDVDDKNIGAIAKREINGLRDGTIVDERGWVVPVKELQLRQTNA